MIAVFIRHRRPPLVVETTEEQIAVWADDPAFTGSQSCPPGPIVQGFEKAWATLALNMQAAHHFPDVHAALEHFRSALGDLTLLQRGHILTALERIHDGTQTFRVLPERDEFPS